MTLTVHQLQEKLAGGAKLRLIDVREADEWALGHLPGAEHIPLSQFARLAPDALVDAADTEPIVLYCHHGIRSAQAQAFLIAQGFPQATNLTGGIDAWAREIDPAMARY